MKMSQGEKTSPMYERIYGELRERIISGSYPHGSRLPSKRMLAEELGVSVITTAKAYELLSDEGYIVSRERSGYFVSYKPGDGHILPSAARPRALPPMPKLSEETMPFTVLSRAMRRVLSDYGERISEKSEGTGAIELRSAIASFLSRSRGIDASAEDIVIGSGAEYLYGLIPALLGRDRIYATERPSYKKIEQVYRSLGAECENLTLGVDGILSEELAASRASVLHISPYRSYPSGVSASLGKRLEYIDWVRGGDRYIIEDDLGSEFSARRRPEETVYSLSGSERVIYVNTFSLTVAPSLRVGYLLLPRGGRAMYEERLGFYSCTVPTFEQYLLAELIGSGELERHINRVRRSLRRSGGEL